MASDNGALSTAAAGFVRTVLGDIPAASLGRALVHDHLFMSLAALYWQPDDSPEMAAEHITLERLGQFRAHPFAARHNMALDDVGDAIRELAPFREAGGGTVVEATCHGLGRDIRALAFIAQRSGVHIVASCGYYIQPTHPYGLHERSEASLAAEFVAELTEGVEGTRVRAGMIKGAAGTYPMHPDERKVLRAAVLAQKETGAPLNVHPAHDTRSALEIARVLERAHAPMDHVLISHLSERFRGDIALYKRLGAYGCYLGFDSFGREMYFAKRQFKQDPTDTERVQWLHRVLDAGFVDRVTLSHDVGQRLMLASYGGTGYAHILKVIVPRMLQSGIPQEAIDRMLVDNPARLMAWACPAKGS